MHKEIRRYPLDFAILFGIFSMVLVFFSQLRHILPAEKLLLFALASFYFLWGIIHHLYHRDLTLRVAIEYASFAALALALGLLLLQLS